MSSFVQMKMKAPLLGLEQQQRLVLCCMTPFLRH